MNRDLMCTWAARWRRHEKLVKMLREAQNTSRGLNVGLGLAGRWPPDLLKSYKDYAPRRARQLPRQGGRGPRRDDGRAREKGRIGCLRSRLRAGPSPRRPSELEDLLRDAPSHNLVLWHKSGDVPRGAFVRNETATSYISKHHTYDARAADVLAHFDLLRDNNRRTGALRVAILWNGAWTPQLQTSLAAAADRLQRLYRIFWVRVADVISQSVDLLHYDVIFAVGKRDSPADRCARSLVREWTLPRHLSRVAVDPVDDGDLNPVK